MELFAGLSSAHLAALKNCGSIRSLPAGTLLFKEGDPAYGLYSVLSGKVEIFRRTAAGEIRLALLEKGETFGEMGILLQSASRTAGARVQEECMLFEITSNPILLLKALSPIDEGRGAIRLVQNIIHTLAERLRRKETTGALKTKRNVGLHFGGERAAGLDDDPRQALEAIRSQLPTGVLASWWNDKSLNPGEYLYRAGDPSTSLYFLQEGEVEVRQRKHSVAEVRVARLTAPSVAGEVGYFLQEPRATAAVALTPVRYTQFPARDFQVLAKKKPEEAFQLLFALAQWIAWLILERETA